MMGLTLWRYLFRRYLVVTGWFVLGMVALIFLVDFTEFASRISGHENYTIGLGIKLSILRLPGIIQVTAPFVILFSAMTLLLMLNRRYELVVARSTGVSAWQFLSPLCVASLLIGIFLITAINPLSARALAIVHGYEVSLGMQRGTVGEIERTPWLRQRTNEGVTIIGAETIAERGLLLGGAKFIRFNEDGEIIERLDAETAELQDGQWVLSNVNRVAGPGPAEIKSAVIQTNLNPRAVEESLAAPEAVSFFELPDKIEVARSFGLGANAFAMQYQSLLALPLLLVAMTLIAATVSLKFIRFGQSVGIILAGILAGFLLYVVSVLAKAFGTAGTVPPFVAAWLPVIVAMALGVTVLLHKEDG
ncbi:MAG: LPS export ABC transporter permease LptG [Rhizobiaceae bacterium MnEN-MB40S]|nr:MAG: LPS export ABC transporter permease LptG [Rhizobiaceae bacterium MnEN-MB40S]